MCEMLKCLHNDNNVWHLTISLFICLGVACGGGVTKSTRAGFHQWEARIAVTWGHVTRGWPITGRHELTGGCWARAGRQQAALVSLASLTTAPGSRHQIFSQTTKYFSNNIIIFDPLSPACVGTPLIPYCDGKLGWWRDQRWRHSQQSIEEKPGAVLTRVRRRSLRIISFKNFV